MHIAYSGVARVSAALDGSWICRPGRILDLPPVEIFVSYPKNFLTTFFFEASLFFADLWLFSNPFLKFSPLKIICPS